MLVERKHQPDILEVISDLSSDEKFTPPSVANAILDLLPQQVWDDPTLKWLDPGCKTGVFLREAAKRLLISDGLKAAFPNEDARLEHILSNMLYGVAITELTALMSRRTIYCSKVANNSHSAAHLASSDGNIWFRRTEHSYAGKRCHECGAVKEQLERENRENYAYAFIHEGGRKAVRRDMDMKFDVIVGNPPYHMTDGGAGASASPIYQDFIQQAIELNPRYVAMIVPSRWFVGGKGLGDFRSQMLADRRVRTIVDYQDARAVFPTINLNGGVNYFLWDRDHDGPCTVTSVHKTGRTSTVTRELSAHGVFIRLNEAIPILEKVVSNTQETFDRWVSSRKPFGFPTDFRGSQKRPAAEPVELYENGGLAWVKRSAVAVNANLIDSWKVLIPAATDGNENYPLPVLTEPIIAGPGTACTETYLVIGPLSSKKKAENVAAYMTTRFFRFLLSLRKHAQHNSREKFSFIPDLDMNRKWTDEDLYKLFDITDDEQAFIAEQIREWGA